VQKKLHGGAEREEDEKIVFVINSEWVSYKVYKGETIYSHFCIDRIIELTSN
jgi:hypothetical protein